MTWIKGTYDSLLKMLATWYRNYDRGRVVTYKKVFDGTEQFIGIHPTSREAVLELNETQMRAIVDMLNLVYPRSKEACYFYDFYRIKYPTCKKVGSKARAVQFVLPKHVVKGILDLFVEFKRGTLSFTARPLIGQAADKSVLLAEGTTEVQGRLADWDEVDEETKEAAKDTLNAFSLDYPTEPENRDVAWEILKEMDE